MIRATLAAKIGEAPLGQWAWAAACWPWLSYVAPDGYGHLHHRRGEKPAPAHRFVYEAIVGPVPPALTLDHLCRNRACVNPLHLEPVTSAENVLRGAGITAENARKERCLRGHEFDSSNTRIDPRGHRRCRACEALYRGSAEARAKTAARMKAYGQLPRTKALRREATRRYRERLAAEAAAGD